MWWYSNGAVANPNHATSGSSTFGGNGGDSVVDTNTINPGDDTCRTVGISSELSHGTSSVDSVGTINGGSPLSTAGCIV